MFQRNLREILLTGILSLVPFIIAVSVKNWKIRGILSCSLLFVGVVQSHIIANVCQVYLVPRSCENHRSIRRQLIEEEEEALELQRSLTQMQFGQKSFSSSPHFGFFVDESRISDDHLNFQSEEEPFNFPLHNKYMHTDYNLSDDNRWQPTSYRR